LEDSKKVSKSFSSNANSPTIALVGCGAIAESFYLPALTKVPNIIKNLVLVDSNEKRAQEISKKYHVKKYFVDYQDILDDIDGVIVAAPNHLHYTICRDFISRGVHVLCEKPLAESADQVREMVKQAQKTKAVLSANYTRRLFASFIKLKEIIGNGRFGQLLSLQYNEGEEFNWPTASGFYFNTKVSQRGVLLDRGAHALDLICWWLGEKPELISFQRDSFGGCEAVAEVRFKHHKCIGEVKLSLLSKLPCRYRFEFERGMVEGDVYDFRNLVLSSESNGKKKIKIRCKEKYYEDFGNKITANFIDVITRGARPLVSGTEVLDSMELIDECYENALRFHMPWYQIPEIRDAK
jgi:predicted dehydrogenase